MTDPLDHAGRSGRRLAFFDDFTGLALDRTRWTPFYLPHWSSRASSKAHYRIASSVLTLSIPANQHPWCPEFDGTVRVSALQTGQFAGPVGSAVGQHRFRTGLVVREEQTPLRLFTPVDGRVEMRARARLDARSLASLYLIGLETMPIDSGEITVMEIFGSGIGPMGTRVGRGLKPINDPRMAVEFLDDPLAIDVEDWHVYAAEWSPDGTVITLDGRTIFASAQAPTYPMQLMLTFYRLAGHDGSADRPDAGFDVDWIRGYDAAC